MIRRWLAWLKAAPSAPQQWRLLVDGQQLATLCHPLPDDMFWTSFEIVPSTSPPDTRLADDSFWLNGDWQLLEATTGRHAALAVASAAGLRREDRRVVLRGLQGPATR